MCKASRSQRRGGRDVGLFDTDFSRSHLFLELSKGLHWFKCHMPTCQGIGVLQFTKTMSSCSMLSRLALPSRNQSDCHTPPLAISQILKKVKSALPAQGLCWCFLQPAGSYRTQAHIEVPSKPSRSDELKLRFS